MSISKWIVLSFVLFAGFIATLVGVCVRQDISLVSKDYYNEELAYQDQIERINNTERLAVKPSISVRGDVVDVDFKSVEGIEHLDLHLFCPSNSSMDRHFRADRVEAAQSFTSEGLQRGMYRAKLRWTMHGKEYYMEEVITL